MPNQRVPSRMRLSLFAAASLAAILPSPALAWGKTGHRIVAALAEPQLSGLARAEIEQILDPGEGLEEAANWPDWMKSDPSPFWQKTATPWHWVTLNGVVYDHAPPEGDALQALTKFTAVLRDPNASRADKQMALRFVVHLVGDLHQPLHVGQCCDEGGNLVKVSWFGKPSNLHTVWDTQIIEDEQLSYSELAAKLQRHTSNADVIAWWDINPRDWITESAQIRNTIYPTMPPAKPQPKKRKKGHKAERPPLPEIGYSYIYKFTPVVERRLSQAGVRLAAYLNEIFDNPPELQGPAKQ